ncbi:type II toxin-antitoxin system HicA family toxin [Candidatus Parcubacteria bacterium]|nr:type II toxin-antitoxin system HicA family toxin [Candidatus Parcubacteria bacterium]
MPKVPPIKAKKLIKILLKNNFFIHHQSGSHLQIRHNTKKHIRATIPRHDRFDLPPSILLSILKQSEITKDEILKWIKNK